MSPDEVANLAQRVSVALIRLAHRRVSGMRVTGVCDQVVKRRPDRESLGVSDIAIAIT